jgi:uncharacterized protein (TIGR03437 family)
MSIPTMTFLRYPLALTLVCLPVLAQVSPAINQVPSREFGHPTLSFGSISTTPNLIEGKELNSPTAIAFDTTSSPPIVYVADTANHRVLAWRNPANLTKGNQADKVIGQVTFFTAFPGGPGASTPALSASGLLLPNGLAVDSSGNLWVLDAGNNRVVRFPRPMDQQGDFVAPNLVIGQKAPSVGNVSNQNQAKPSDKTLSFNRSGSVTRGSITFDSQGNLWVADTLNHRVLRFPKDRLNVNEPSADLVLGQLGFETDTQGTVYTNLTSLSGPVGLAVDDRGGVYVSDSQASVPRVLYFDAPSNGATAARILGLEPTGTNPPRPPAPNDYTLGRVGNQGGVNQCLFTVGTVVFVCDNVANRIVRYASPEAWPAVTNSALSPPIAAVYGQNTLTDGGINRGGGLSRPGNSTLYSPTSAAIFNNELWVVDAGNNRVLAFSSTGPLNFPTATRVVGQLDYDLSAPNMVDGRELFVSSQTYRGSSIVVDRNSTPNHVYVADSLNNRILGFKDIRTVGVDTRTLLTQTADIIIGQQDRFHTGVNYPTYDALVPTDQGLNTPSGVTVDDAGNVWVADTGNGRVLRFPDPFKQPAGTAARANLVLGQFGFSDRITDASSSTMYAPVGVAIFNYGDVAVSDLIHNRVLLFHKNGADFVNGQSARAVLGQSNFFSSGESSAAAGLHSPRGIATDANGRLYVTDPGNARVVVYGGTSNTPNGAQGITIPNLNSPEGIAVNPKSGEIWVAALGAGRVYRFPEFSQLIVSPTPTAELLSAAPIALTLDAFDNVIVVEATNRMTFYFSQAVYQHAATYSSGSPSYSTLTPNLYVNLYRLGKPFELQAASATIPYPKTLGGLQVLVNGTPAAVYLVTTDSIRFIVPNNAPTAGSVEYLVTRPATGEIVAAGNFTMGAAAPGFFTANTAGTGQIAATNEDRTVNSPANRIGQDQILTLWMTGFGHLDNMPPDGEAGGTALATDVKPRINIGNYTVPDDKILYSGLSPEFPALWQINIRMPKNGEPNAPAPSPNYPILVQMRDVPSNVGLRYSDGELMTVGNQRITTIAIK